MNKMPLQINLSQKAVWRSARRERAAALLVLLIFANSNPGHAALFFDSGTLNLRIPDGGSSGLVQGIDVTGVSDAIGKVEVSLSISGYQGNAFNGDLYVTLQHESGFAVLLNRAGRRAENGFGYGDNGIDVTFSDSAANGDIHNYRLTLNGSHSAPIAGRLSGVWSPDARNVDPALVLDDTPRTAFLSSFNGLNPNGTWSLYLADLDPGGAAQLDSWGLQIVPVPEPSSALALGILLLCGTAFASARRRLGFGDSRQQRLDGSGQEADASEAGRGVLSGPSQREFC